jgi:hypothetical protein
MLSLARKAGARAAVASSSASRAFHAARPAMAPPALIKVNVDGKDVEVPSQ